MNTALNLPSNQQLTTTSNQNLNFLILDGLSEKLKNEIIFKVQKETASNHIKNIKSDIINNTRERTYYKKIKKDKI